MKAKIIDSFSYKNSHLQYNTSFLVMCSLIYPEVECYSNKVVYNSIKSLLDDAEIKRTNINYKYIYVVNGPSKIKLFLRYIVGSIINIYMLLFSKKDDLLIYNLNNLFSLHAINFINKILHRKILICCHGELELFISDKDNLGLLAILLRLLLKSFFSKKRKIEKNIYFIVLGDLIKENLSNYILKNHMQKFLAVDHSYIFSSHEEVERKDDCILFGTVGAFDKSKGGDLLIQLASSIDSKNIRFKVVGQVFSNIDELKKNNIIISGKNPFVPLEHYEFNKEVSSLDYIIYLYPTDSYKLKASGAIMDAINMRKSIIALKNDYFEYIFNKYGSFGYLFDNITEMKKFMLQDIEMKISFDFDDIQKKLSPISLYKDLQSKLVEISFL